MFRVLRFRSNNFFPSSLRARSWPFAQKFTSVSPLAGISPHFYRDSAIGVYLCVVLVTSVNIQQPDPRNNFVPSYPPEPRTRSAPVTKLPCGSNLHIILFANGKIRESVNVKVTERHDVRFALHFACRLHEFFRYHWTKSPHCVPPPNLSAAHSFEVFQPSVVCASLRSWMHKKAQ